MGKSLFKSKTFLVNLAIVVAAALTGILDTSIIQENPGLVTVLGGILGMVNIILRLVTKEPIK